jgi:hypothetical protein
MELILCSEEGQRSFALQPAPTPWLHLHSIATGASLAAGALTYTLTHIAGTTTTNTLANTVNITGSLVAHGTRMVAGDIAGIAVQSGTNTATYLIRQGGQAATQMGSLVASSVAAVAVGSAFLLGNTVYQVCKKVVPGTRVSVEADGMSNGISMIESIEELPEDTLLLSYDVTTATPCDSVGNLGVPTSSPPSSPPTLVNESVQNPNVFPEPVPIQLD